MQSTGTALFLFVLTFSEGTFHLQLPARWVAAVTRAQKSHPEPIAPSPVSAQGTQAHWGAAGHSTWTEAIYIYFRNKNNFKMQHPCREICMSQGWVTAVPCETLGVLWLTGGTGPWGIVPIAHQLWFLNTYLNRHLNMFIIPSGLFIHSCHRRRDRVMAMNVHPWVLGLIFLPGQNLDKPFPTMLCSPANI